MSCKDSGVIPATGFPRVNGMGNEERAKTTRTRCKHEHLMHRKHSFSEGHLGGYTFEACILERIEFVVEVVVHESSWEVVAHVTA